MHSTLIRLSTQAAARRRWIAGGSVLVIAVITLIVGDANSLGTVNY